MRSMFADPGPSGRRLANRKDLIDGHVHYRMYYWCGQQLFMHAEIVRPRRRVDALQALLRMRARRKFMLHSYNHLK